MDKIDEEYMNELAKGQTDSSKAALDIKINDDGTTLQTLRVSFYSSGSQCVSETTELYSVFFFSIGLGFRSE